MDSTESAKSTVYSSASPAKHPWSLLRDIAEDIRAHRELTWVMFQRDLRAQFRQSFLGYVWLLAPPFATAIVWYLLNKQRLIQVDVGDVPYPAFVLIGSTLWTCFATAVMSPSETINANKEVLTKMNVPIEPFLLAGFARAVFNLIASMIVILPVLATQGIEIRWTLVLFPFSAFAFLSFGFVVGLLIAPIGSLYTDFQKAMPPLLNVLMFTLPVVIPIPENSGYIHSLMSLNPLTPSLSLSRDNILSGNLVWTWPTLLWFLFTAVIGICLLAILRVAKPHLVARLGM